MIQIDGAIGHAGHARGRAFPVCALSFLRRPARPICACTRTISLSERPVTPRLRAAVSRQGPGITTITAENHYKISAASRCRQNAHMTIGDHATHAIPGVCATSRMRESNTCSYVRTKPYKPHYCPSESAPDDRGKVDDSPRSRSTRAAPEHTHSVQATKLRRWQYRYMWYGGPIDCTSLIRS